MIVTVSVLRSPPCRPSFECIAMSSLSSEYGGSLVRLSVAWLFYDSYTCTPVDDSVMGSQYELE